MQYKQTFKIKIINSFVKENEEIDDIDILLNKSPNFLIKYGIIMYFFIFFLLFYISNFFYIPNYLLLEGKIVCKPENKNSQIISNNIYYFTPTANYSDLPQSFIIDKINISIPICDTTLFNLCTDNTITINKLFTKFDLVEPGFLIEPYIQSYECIKKGEHATLTIKINVSLFKKLRSTLFNSIIK